MPRRELQENLWQDKPNPYTCFRVDQLHRINKPLVSVKKNTTIYGRSSGASTDRTHNLNRNLSLTAISSTSNNQQSRNVNRTRDLKSKGSISSNSSYHHTSTGKMSTSNTFRQTIGDESDRQLKLMENVRILKSENK